MYAINARLTFEEMVLEGEFALARELDEKELEKEPATIVQTRSVRYCLRRKPHRRELALLALCL